MLDYAVGELAEMKYINELEILNIPHKQPALTLVQLMSHFMQQFALGKDELFDEERYCNLYSAYQMQPDEEFRDGLRADVFAGSSCFIPLLNEFLRGENRIMDCFHADGIAAVSIFAQSGIDWVIFHRFRQDADSITLFDRTSSSSLPL